MGADEREWRKNPHPEGSIVQFPVPFVKESFATEEEPNCWWERLELPASLQGVKISRA